MDRKKNRNIFNKKIISFVILFAILLCVLVFSASAVSDSTGRIVYNTGEVSNDGYAPIDFHVENSIVTNSNNYSALKNATAVPASYDSRKAGVVTDIKDQGYFGACWAFATTASAESSLISEFPEKYTDSTVDLSELHLAYFTYNIVPDALGLTSGEGLSLLGNSNGFLDQGGNLYYSTFQLAKWFGVADEAVAPYTKASKTFTISSKKAYNSNEALLENAIWVPMTNQTTVKKMIMKYGAGGVSYYHDNLYLNSSTAAYFHPTLSIFNGTLIANHSVTVVGWDDNYSRSKFGMFKPKKNGAWLIKNSYGTSFGDEGYIWISYEDSSLFEDDAIFFDMMPTDAFEKNYQYDMSDVMGAYYCKDYISMANVFTSQSDEKLSAVSFTTLEQNVTYSLQIYRNLTSTTNPTKGTKVYSTELRGTFPLAGYHTIPLPREVQLYASKSFSVVITLSLEGKNVSAVIDEPSNSGTVKSITKSKKGQSFVSTDTGKTWDDLYYEKYYENLRIKAFTNTGMVAPSTVTIGGVTSGGIAVGEAMKLSFSVSPKRAYDKVKWTSSDKTIASVSSNGTVVGKSCGYVIITCTSAAGNVKQSVKIKVRPSAPTALKQTKCTTVTYAFSWNQVANADGYEIYKYDSKTKSVVYVTSTKKPSYSLSYLKSGLRDKYYVRAYKTVDNKVIKGDFAAIYLVTKPSTVTAKYSSRTASSVTIKWNKSAGAIGYSVYRYNTSTKKYTKLKYTTALSLKITPLKANTTYVFCVRPYTKVSSTGFYGNLSNKLAVKTSK